MTDPDDRARSPAGEHRGAHPPETAPSAPTETFLPALERLAGLVEERLPPRYRTAAFRLLAEAALAGRTGPREPALPEPSQAVPPPMPSPTTERHLDLAAYAPIFAAPGRILLKALAVLDVARRQLGVEWMTPSEIERFLTERARVRSAYRTNISNALRGARHLAERRRRGRGYEYALTSQGSDLLERERSLLG